MPKPARPPRSLSIVVESLIGHRLSVELRNDVVLTGLLDSVDAKMNLTMDDAQYARGAHVGADADADADAGAGSRRFDKVYVASRHITLIELPAELDIAQHVDNHVNRLAALRYSNTGGKRRRRV